MFKTAKQIEIEKYIKELERIRAELQAISSHIKAVEEEHGFKVK